MTYGNNPAYYMNNIMQTVDGYFTNTLNAIANEKRWPTQICERIFAEWNNNKYDLVPRIQTRLGGAAPAQAVHSWQGSLTNVIFQMYDNVIRSFNSYGQTMYQQNPYQQQQPMMQMQPQNPFMPNEQYTPQPTCTSQPQTYTQTEMLAPITNTTKSAKIVNKVEEEETPYTLPECTMTNEIVVDKTKITTSRYFHSQVNEEFVLNSITTDKLFANNESVVAYVNMILPSKAFKHFTTINYNKAVILNNVPKKVFTDILKEILAIIDQTDNKNKTKYLNSMTKIIDSQQRGIADAVEQLFIQSFNTYSTLLELTINNEESGDIFLIGGLKDIIKLLTPSSIATLKKEFVDKLQLLTRRAVYDLVKSITILDIDKNILPDISSLVRNEEGELYEESTKAILGTLSNIEIAEYVKKLDNSTIISISNRVLCVTDIEFESLIDKDRSSFISAQFSMAFGAGMNKCCSNFEFMTAKGITTTTAPVPLYINITPGCTLQYDTVLSQETLSINFKPMS